MRILGLMSGTSHDGVDAAVVDFNAEGEHLRGTLVWSTLVPYPDQLRQRLQDALPPAEVSLREVAALDSLIGQHFAKVPQLANEGSGGYDAVCSHGQTMYHWVEDGVALGSLQLGAPAWIAEACGKPVVANFRLRDIAAGGQGAPLVPLLDQLLLAGLPGRNGALNLGGIANVTIIGGSGGVEAFDIGPANALIDAVIQDRGLNRLGYDAGGTLAASGTVDEELLSNMKADPYFSAPLPKSTGKEHFNLDFVTAHLRTLGRSISQEDLIATLTELTAVTVAEEISRYDLTTLVVSGGGFHNPVLMDSLCQRMKESGTDVVSSDCLNAPVDDKEAILCALIGWFTLHGLPAGVPSVTGARAPRILGDITPGSGPLMLPSPVPRISALTLS
ncbi:anhydro-N-acetylmuramic acid kinase [Actinomyces minihominis]|uniref:anhydro-N-acetylmuramic acid kinase n=1 Tax=Actinomyces minihominis TaxID=2002838 RepID=UPI000C073666|nr:anhydro-N-acetylmuramic acid kinase [Actinomyces minihominis]